jgi:hypothetical protein
MEFYFSGKIIQFTMVEIHHFSKLVAFNLISNQEKGIY